MKRFILSFIVTILISSSFILTAKAQDSNKKEPKRHVLLQRLIDEKNLRVDYLGNSYGLDGWVLRGGDDGKTIQYVYTTPQGGLVLGLLFGPNGEVETSNQIRSMLGKLKENKLAEKIPENKAEDKEKETKTATQNDEKSKTNKDEDKVEITKALENYRKAKKKIEERYKKQVKNKSKKSSEKSEKFYAETEKSAWVALGNKNAPYIYMYMNPGCIHCKNYWKDLKKAVDAGDLQVRLIPFGKVDINRHAGAALLSVADPKTAWDSYVNGNEKALDKSFAKKENYKKIKKNTALFAKWSLPMPPFTVYRSPETGAIKVISGRPKNVYLLLAEFLEF